MSPFFKSCVISWRARQIAVVSSKHTWFSFQCWRGRRVTRSHLCRLQPPTNYMYLTRIHDQINTATALSLSLLHTQGAYHIPVDNQFENSCLEHTAHEPGLIPNLHLEPKPHQAAAIMNRLFGAKNNAPKPTLNSAISNVRALTP